MTTIVYISIGLILTAITIALISWLNKYKRLELKMERPNED